MKDKKLYAIALRAALRNETLVTYREIVTYTRALYEALCWGKKTCFTEK